MAEEFSEVQMRVGLSSRLLAAVWFALTACIPVVYFFGIFGRTALFGPDLGIAVAVWIVLPISLAAFFGFTIGSKILDKRSGESGWTAPFLGALVAIASYCGMMLGYALVAVVGDSRSWPNPLEVFGLMLLMGLYGMLIVGWLVVIAGAVSGGLLFLWASSYSAPSITWITKAEARRLNYGAVAILFVALSFCLLPWWGSGR